jgi:hypothetical protein
MIRVTGKAAMYGELWYNEALPADPGVDIVLYRHHSTPIANARHVRRHLTLVLDLAPPPEALLASFNRDCRQKIRRAEEKDRLQWEFITAPAGRLQEFCDFFDRFAQQKSLPRCDRPWLEAAHRSGRLVLSLARADDGMPLVWHAHVNMGHTVWLQHSVSCFRDKDSESRALIGRANRWLHWKDIQRFRDMGVKRYDWGGLFEDESIPEQEGINRFKKSFGGHVEQRYDSTVPLTLKGHLYLPLRDAWRRWSAAPAAAAA